MTGTPRSIAPVIRTPRGDSLADQIFEQMTRAYYAADSSKLLEDGPDYVLGCLLARSPYVVTPDQRDAWVEEIRILRGVALDHPDAHFYFEFSIPRMGRRADAVILWKGVIYVVEFKVGATAPTRGGLEQVLGYALDLKNFHETSHDRRIVPILLPTRSSQTTANVGWYPDQVSHAVVCSAERLSQLLSWFSDESALPLHATQWEHGRYKPTPTIIEAAQALYRNHSVAEITRSEAGATNLSDTANCIDTIIDKSKACKRKAICFVTGVPGSGKTLAGLNIATRRMRSHDDEHAVFLSGNGPLVDVLREALAQDALAQARISNQPTSKASEVIKASAFVQNIHHFRDEALQSSAPMLGKVVVFDEAQRAWDALQTQKFMQKRRGQQNFSVSEPHFLLSVLDRHPDWAVFICLIGGGQEINTGEAGLPEWFKVLSDSFTHWDVYVSSALNSKDYFGDATPQDFEAWSRATDVPALHLSVSIRSFRAEKVSQFIGAVLDDTPQAARQLIAELENYPIVVTRDISSARAWLRAKRRGAERAGLLASSNGHRLKPHGVFVRSKIEPTYWFLAHQDDVRCSDALEDAATEFEVQGLELDWACVCWDANLRRDDQGWGTYKFSGSEWQAIRDKRRQRFLLNAYRVLLTRARQGLVIFVPRGDDIDVTRNATYYDGVVDYFTECGVPELSFSAMPLIESPA